MKRIVFLDYVRVFACFLVIVVHASENFSMAAVVPPTWQAHNLFWPMSPIGCGCPFTMVSHAWLFRYSSSSLPFFLHR